MRVNNKNVFIKIISVVAVLIMFLGINSGFNTKNAYATGNVSIEVSSVEGNIGDIVSVDVRVVPDVDGIVYLSVSYDTNYLEYVSGGANSGVAGLVLDILDGVKPGEGTVTTLNFKLKAAGSTTISVSDNTQAYPVNATDDSPMAVAKTDGTVTINSSSTASGDCFLAGLTIQAVNAKGEKKEVALTPAFSRDVFEYVADAPNDTKSYIVSTTLSDATASSMVTGTKINNGDNKTEIVVTAANGATNTYNVYTTIDASAVENTEEQKKEEETKEVVDEKLAGIDRSPLFIEDINMYLIQDFSFVSVPNGFKEVATKFRNKDIVALKNEDKGLVLVCLATDARGSNANLYIFTEATNAIDEMVIIKCGDTEYIVMPTDPTYKGPEGYKETTLSINDKKVRAWIKEDGSSFYVVYVMNGAGEVGLYVYDSKEGTMQRFMEDGKGDEDTNLPDEKGKEYQALRKDYNNLNEKYNKNKTITKTYLVVIFILILVIIAIIAVLVYTIKNRRRNRRKDESQNSDKMYIEILDSDEKK